MTKPAQKTPVATKDIRTSNRVAGKDPPTTSEIQREFTTPPDPPIKETAMDFDQQGLRPNAESVNRLSETAEERRKRVAESLKNQADNGLKPLAEVSTVRKKAVEDDVNDEKENGDPENEELLSRFTDDPEPLPETATNAEKATYRRVLLDYTREMFDAYESMSLTGESLWLDFSTAFRPQSIRIWPRPTASRWADLLIRKGIHVNVGKRRHLASALIELLYREVHIPATRMEIALQETKVIESKKVQDEEEEVSPKSDEVTFVQRSVSVPDGGDPDGDDSSSDDSDEEDKKDSCRKDYKKKKPMKKEGVPRSDRHETTDSDSETRNSKSNSLGINGLIKAYARRQQFSGAWDEDLDTLLSVYDTMAQMCGALEEEKLQAMPVMLCGNALNFFSEKRASCETYEDATEMLRQWYNSTEKKSRILHAWQKMMLSEAMTEQPDASQVDVFRGFVARLMSLQKQLDISYHSDQFLRDRLLSAVDIPEIQVSLRDRVPRNSSAAINRIANRLSEKPRTAGTISAMLSMDFQGNDAEAMYSLGRTYGGQARGTPRTPWKRGSGRFRGSSSNSYNRQNSHRKLSSGWLRGVKGCFVCGRNHMARERHSRDEVTAAIKRLKNKQPTALLTVDDLDFLQDSLNEMPDEIEEADEDDDVHWAENEEESQEEEAFLIEIDMQTIEESFSNAAFVYGMMGMENETFNSKLGEEKKMAANQQSPFLGVRLDTCANRASLMSISQYNSYCVEFMLKPHIRKDTSRIIRGIGGRLRPIGEARIQIPFLNLSLVIDVDFLIVEEAVPSLLSMRDMYDNGLDLSIQERRLKFKGRSEPLIFTNYFLIYRWQHKSIPYVLYTREELETIHRSFGHPSVRATAAMLQRANGDSLDRETRMALKEISESCKICALEGAPPRRFKLTVGTEQLKFNHTVQVDTMFIGSRPVIHIVDEATHLCAASFLKKQSSLEIWNAIQRLWLNVYLGPPDFLAVDQGSAYISKEMKSKAEAYGISIREAPIETPGTIGIVERYHAPLRRAFECIRRDLDRTTSDDDCLSMAVFSVNTTTGPEGLCPVLLVYGAMPRPARIAPAATQLQRSAAIEKAKVAVQKEQTRRRVAFGLRHKSGSKGKEASAALRELPVGAEVLVYRKVTKKWEGPFRFVSVDGETVIVQLPHGRRIFSSVCVKPWPKQKNESDEAWTVFMAGRSKAAKGTKEQRKREFAESRKMELKGLIENGTFEEVRKQDIPEGSRIFGSRFVDELKKAGSGIRKKSRLVAQNYSDVDAGSIATKAPTVQRFSTRLLLTIAASTPGWQTFTRDITQAYVQSSSQLERDVYIKAPEELNLEEGSVLKVVKPLYGIPESGLHWYLTYLHHHLGDLTMRQSTSDPCLLFRRGPTGIDAIVALQVDDSLVVGSPAFTEQEECASTKFKTKPRDFINGSNKVSFNGMDLVKKEDGRFEATQEDKIVKLQKLDTNKGFASQRAAAQYVGVCTRPEICAAVQLIAPGSVDVPSKDIKSLHSTIDFLQSTKEVGLRFVKLNLRQSRIVLLSDASFANAQDDKSQLGFIILLVDKENNANVIHYASSRCKRVTRSVLAAEIHALVAGFDMAFVIQHMILEILGWKMNIEAFVDSKTMFQVVTKDSSTTERRLQIDISALKQSYNSGEITRLAWISGKANPADALTKPTVSTLSPLWKLMTSSKLEVEAVGWSTSNKEDMGTESVKQDKKC